MTIYYVQRVQMGTGGTDHEHIVGVELWDATSNVTTPCGRQKVVDMINGRADVRTKSADGKEAKVEVRPGPPPFLQTRADGALTNNLLKLPRYT